MKGLIFGIGYFFLELGLFVLFAQEFGFLALVGEILLSALVGFFLLTSTFTGFSVIEALREMKSPQEFIASNLSKTFGAILLILPGILSDCLGILLQIGILDHWIAKMIVGFYSQTPKSEQDCEIIDVEILSEKNQIKEKDNEKSKNW